LVLNNHKTYKTIQNFKETQAAQQPCRRREAAGWRASHNPKKGFAGFESFVIKNN
jgi:hypothetical protein